MDESPFLDVSDVARILGLTDGRVYQLIAEGVIPSTRLSPGRIKIPRAVFQDWLRLLNARAANNVRDAVPG